MDRLIERCAMLDIHKSQITACVRVPDDAGGRRQEIREFRTTTAGLLTLADWLRSWAVTVVGMEVHRRLLAAVFYLLEDEFECRLYNAAPSSSRPRPQERCPRRRVGLPADRARAGPAELRAAPAAARAARPGPLPQSQDPGAHPRGAAGREDLAGRRDQAVLGRLRGARRVRPQDARRADLRHSRPRGAGRLAKGALRKKIPALREALQGRFTGHHALLIGQMLAQIDFLDETIADAI